MNVVRDFRLIVVSVVSEEKQCSERSQMFHYNSSEVKQRGKRSQANCFP